MLPGHRHVHLRLFAEAPTSDSSDIASALATSLSPHGSVEVREHGPYSKIPENLEFTVQLTPLGSVASCLSALGVGGDGWTDDVWNHVPGSAFLHPSIKWASVLTEEAMSPPRFKYSEIVLVLDSPAAREQGLAGKEAVVRGSSAPTPGDAEAATWHYAVAADGGDLVMLSEEQLQPTGRTAPSEPTTWISVTSDGRVTGRHPTGD